MLNHTILFNALLLLGCASAEPAEERTAVVTDDGTTAAPPPGKGFPLAGLQIMFYNVENLYDTEDDPATDDKDFLPGSEQDWTPERLSKKLQHLAEAVSMAGGEPPVFLGLAEVENRKVVERLASETALKAANYGVVHQDSPDERGIDVALLFDQDIFKLIRFEALNVPLPDDDRTRDILHGEFTTQGHTFHVFVNHWPSRREGQQKSEPKRMAAAHVLKEALAKIPDAATTHVIIMGDFNDTPTDRSIQEGLGATCTNASTGLVDLMCVDQPAGHGSHQYDSHWDYLDQFIVGGELTTHVKEAKALWDDRLLFKHPKYGLSPDKTYSGRSYKGGYSDHLPIVLRFN